MPYLITFLTIGFLILIISGLLLYWFNKKSKNTKIATWKQVLVFITFIIGIAFVLSGFITYFN